MGAASWAIPVGILCAIVVVALAFVWWWFPRAWQKGINDDARAIAEAGEGDSDERAAIRLANREKARAIVQRALDAEQARKRGEVVEIGGALEYDEHGKPIKPAGYSAV